MGGKPSTRPGGRAGARRGRDGARRGGVAARGGRGRHDLDAMRILLVTQMWPSPENPDLGSFLVPLARELETMGHEVDVAAISRRGGPPTKYARLTGEALAAARRRRPDVVFVHFLFPAGAAGALAAVASRAPLVVMAHGQDVANLGRIRGVTAATRRVVGRAAAVITNSRWLADRLVERIPAARAKLEIADCGVDLDAFAPRPPAEARRELGWEGDGPAFLCVGSLIGRKNVVRLADAFARLDRGRLAFVGDGPLRCALEGRADVRVSGRIPQTEVPRWIAACDVLCQPSLVEPFGQATLEGMAMERSVVATAIGGPPEFVPAEAGVLVDPHDTEAVAAGLERAAELPSPNQGARKAAEEHDVRRQAARMAAILERAR
jgi:glycosyltransferase involved in cell wall biosynthesis